MEIRSIRHKALRRLVEDDVRSGLPAAAVPKIAAILSFLQDATGVDVLASVPAWRAHLLTGDRRGTWSLTVTRNWRITFRIDDEGTIVDLDFEDYH